MLRARFDHHGDERGSVSFLLLLQDERKMFSSKVGGFLR